MGAPNASRAGPGPGRAPSAGAFSFARAASRFTPQKTAGRFTPLVSSGGEHFTRPPQAAHAFNAANRRHPEVCQML
jgi:hypothetical protein